MVRASAETVSYPLTTSCGPWLTHDANPTWARRDELYFFLSLPTPAFPG